MWVVQTTDSTERGRHTRRHRIQLRPARSSRDCQRAWRLSLKTSDPWNEVATNVVAREDRGAMDQAARYGPDERVVGLDGKVAPRLPQPCLRQYKCRIHGGEDTDGHHGKPDHHRIPVFRRRNDGPELESESPPGFVALASSPEADRASDKDVELPERGLQFPPQLLVGVTRVLEPLSLEFDDLGNQFLPPVVDAAQVV